ncbi:hypothetical protein [Neobacillus niacini]|nr:hypothetical protein [Neobacillus niacini]
MKKPFFIQEQRTPAPTVHTTRTKVMICPRAVTGTIYYILFIQLMMYYI